MWNDDRHVRPSLLTFPLLSFFSFLNCQYKSDTYTSFSFFFFKFNTILKTTSFHLVKKTASHGYYDLDFFKCHLH
jgi:hypothetical protein